MKNRLDTDKEKINKLEDLRRINIEVKKLKLWNRHKTIQNKNKMTKQKKEREWRNEEKAVCFFLK